MRFNEKFAQDFAAGEAVFAEGEAGDKMFVVLAGQVEIFRQDGAGCLPLATQTA